MFSYNETTYDDLINQNSDLIYLFGAVKGLSLNRINYKQIQTTESDIIMEIDVYLSASVELKYKYYISKSGTVLTSGPAYTTLTTIIEKWVNSIFPKYKVYDAGIFYNLPVSRVSSI